MKQCILVIFVDSLMSSDYSMLKELDNFKYIISKGTIVNKVYNQYPNLKAPASASILTGELPYRHGIYFDSNDIYVRKYREKEYEDIRVPTLLDLLKKNGNKIGIISWPTMGNSGFKYNFNQINSEKLSNVCKSILKGSSFYMAKNIYKYSDIFKINMQPECDNFYSILAMELLERKSANVIFMGYDHLSYVRKRYLRDSDNTYEALKSIDKKIGDLIRWCDNKNILDNMTLCIASSGGFNDLKNVININYAFSKHDLLNFNNKQSIKNYVAYAHCAGGSAFIYLKNPNNMNEYGKVKVFLNSFLESNSQYIKGVYESYGYENSDLDNFSFRLEAQPNCIFDGGFKKESIIEEFNLNICSLNSKVKSYCGYSNTDGDSTGVFIGYGNKVKVGNRVERCDIIDIAPTIASFMDLNFECSGKIIKGMKV